MEAGYTARGQVVAFSRDEVTGGGLDLIISGGAGGGAATAAAAAADDDDNGDKGRGAS
ncbi:hypothetical protein VTK26DRAFT_4116 [Humicola hyalothermophila]